MKDQIHTQWRREMNDKLHASRRLFRRLEMIREITETISGLKSRHNREFFERVMVDSKIRLCGYDLDYDSWNRFMTKLIADNEASLARLQS